jgi:thiamine biosynthesis lipoprotein ApbE
VTRVVLAALAVLMATGCASRLQRHEFREIHMGSEARVVVYTEDVTAAAAAARAAFDRIAELDAIMSDYRDDSEVMRVCREQMPGEMIEVSEDLYDVLWRSREISEATGGAFDVTVGPYTRAWRRAVEVGVLPPTMTDVELRSRVGFRGITFAPNRHAIMFDRAGVEIDFGAIGKGYACDEALERVRERGVERCLVELGGDLAVGAPPPGADAWRVKVESPGGQRIIELASGAITTSADRFRYVDVGGERYSHILDARTGALLTSRLAVTVSAPDATTADALATAISVVGPKEGTWMMQRFPGASALMERADVPGSALVTAGFPRIVEQTIAPPSPAPVVDPDAPPEGFRALFNGRDLSGWRGLVGGPPKMRAMDPASLREAQTEADRVMSAHWSVRDGVLHFDGKGSHLVTAGDYRDFELRLDWKITPGGDSGIYLRGVPQVQIWDNAIGSGGLYNNQKNPSRPLVVADHAPGQWNAFRIVMVGDRVSVWLNGSLVVDDTPLENYWERDRPLYETGPIELQSHGSELWFRRVWIREIQNASDVR